jgi:hypothetical protein
MIESDDDNKKDNKGMHLLESGGGGQFGVTVS